MGERTIPIKGGKSAQYIHTHTGSGIRTKTGMHYLEPRQCLCPLDELPRASEDMRVPDECIKRHHAAQDGEP
jgi:hypothetical protein